MLILGSSARRRRAAGEEPLGLVARWLEPSLAEVLEDPIVHLVLRRDGLTPSDVRRAVEAARSRLRKANRENSGMGDAKWRDQRG